jgi:cbb3-type cytochrome oxidase maturation protein
MTVPLVAVVLICVAVFAAAVALSAFVWAVRTGQFSIKHLNEGAYAVFDEEDRLGEAQDMIFAKSDDRDLIRRHRRH